jgi:hypothetical protein
MSLDEKSLEACTERNQHKVVVAKEHGRVFTLHNNNGIWISKIRLDGCYFTSTNKSCDYLLELDQPISYALYIELKGSDVSKAYAQLDETIRHFSTRHGNLPRKCYIIATRVPKETPTIANMKRRWAKQNIKIEIHTDHHTSKTSDYLSL